MRDPISSQNNLGIQFAPQLFSTESSPKILGRLVRPTVTNANRHQKKYEVNKPTLGSILLTG